MARMPFVKMEGCGNDYVFVDTGLTSGGVTLPGAVDLETLSVAVSNRHTGIGSDGLILIGAGSRPDAVRMRMHNADGSEGRLCLNGLRCVALYAASRVPALASAFVVETASGPRRVRVEPTGPGQGMVEVEAGRPDFSRQGLPAIGPDDEFWDQPVDAEGVTGRGFGVSVGNPHLVLWLPEAGAVADAPLERFGPRLEHDSRFPEGINVHLAATVGSGEVVLRSWERGSGLTQACGSGAVGVFAVGRRLGQVEHEASVRMPGGTVVLRERPDGSLLMRGPAREVFHGEWPLGG